ncbi:MAG: hypothetical protein RLZZ528_579 [Pseudomonadota bacterium]|jgi:RimJ/RimL family protein N-acetyltransferase
MTIALADTPVLTTERLVLRAPRVGDVAAFAAFWTSDRTRFMGGPWTEADAEAEFPELARQWRRHGFSLFAITRRGDDDAIGLAGPFFPEGHPEPELAWNLWNAGDEGQGMATEAARAARDWFFATSAYRTAVSYTHPENTASHRLAERLGATPDPQAPCPYPPPVRVYRHNAKVAA